jgi:phosphoglycerate dehydrogenase-like enzyme
VWPPVGDVQDEDFWPELGGALGDVLPASDTTFFVPPYMQPTDLEQVFAALPSLRVVQTLTAGYDDVLRLLPPGVTLCNARGVHDASTAELAVALVLASLRGLPEFVRAQGAGRWLAGRRPSLADRHVVVVGAGSVGSAVAARLEPFETEVVLVGRTSRDGVRAVSDLPQLLPTADVVVLAVPLTEQTERMVDAGFLAGMRDGALLVNVARGRVVDTDALLAELVAGRLSAALDVTDPEPLPPEHPLWRAPGVLLSPHVGGDTTAFLPRAWRMLQAQLARYVAGEPLANVVAGPGSPA